MIKVYFCTSYKPGGLLIQACTKSRYSHAAIEVDGKIYESRLATGVHCPEKLHGVAKVVTLNNLNGNDAKAFLEAQVGKPYDKKAIFSFMFIRNWEDLGAWFCSELVAMALKVEGVQGFPSNVSKISPGDLDQIITNKTKFTAKYRL